MIGVFRVKAPKAVFAALILSIVRGVAGWKMPLGQALSGTAEGITFGLFPILWILVNALWVYRLTVATPWFEVLGQTIRSVSRDHRVLAILIAFAFGAPVLMAVSNSTAGALGKMVCLQNLAVAAAAAAAALAGGESILFRKMLWWSMALLALLAAFILLQTTPILGWMVPS